MLGGPSFRRFQARRSCRAEPKPARITLLPGVKINTSATDFAPIEQLQMQRFKGEKWDLFGDILSGELSN